MRKWRALGRNAAILDLKTAYMQIHVDRSLWPFQTVIFRGRRFCLTRLGFGLSIAPAVMKAVLSAVLSKDSVIKEGTSPFVDDIFVNEDVVKAAIVRDHLRNHGLICKPAERVSDGTRVLGLSVKAIEGRLAWKRSNAILEVPVVLTRRSVFSLCGKLIGHLPVCGWLRPAVAHIKREANLLSDSWDEEIHDLYLRSIVEQVVGRVKVNDPGKGRWDVDGEEADVWVDASSLAFGVAIAVGGNVIEDASWLRTNDGGGLINMAEFDAIIKGINMALTWHMKKLHLKTYSQTVLHWVSDALTGKSRLRTKAVSEMFIRRRLSIILSLIEEYELEVDVAFVPSALNLADALTRVPQR